MTTSASRRASLRHCLACIGLFLPSKPRDMPPKKHGIPRACSAKLYHHFNCFWAGDDYHASLNTLNTKVHFLTRFPASYDKKYLYLRLY